MPLTLRRLRTLSVPLLAGLLLLPGCRSQQAPSGPAPSATREALKTREGYLPGADGMRLYYQLEGTGPEVLVFVQGGPGGDLREEAPDFGVLAKDRTVIYYDHRGGGRSTLPEDASLLTIDALVEDLEAVRRHFGLERMDVAAFSFGPIVAGRYSARYPDRVGRLLLVGAVGPRRVPYSEQYGQALFSLASEAQRRRMMELFQTWGTAEDPIALCREYWSITGPMLMSAEGRARKRSEHCVGTAESVRYGLTKTSPRVIASLGDWDLRQELGAVRATTLVIHGEADLFSVEGAREWAAAIPGARLLEVPGAGHAPHLERPEVFNPAVETFLSGRWPEGARVP
ncbi:alpha/beta hydrolase [Pyxidicoccus fallax]|uniref:Alpha/beta hydrolase n=1 Tax=Pyxidicoccus fallax TaxID=394095 RepID=A0A848LPN1_9BACT|nr:alpha/beta hydrolase [Pyxidicoccus fallax]NMO19845.1 alpha/beta hydrolase [Pyxidicoccus fallax]NPC85076.1 alpha/beta hydrolase [Pyxidicoccus fallax]